MNLSLHFLGPEVALININNFKYYMEGKSIAASQNNLILKRSWVAGLSNFLA